VEKKKGKKKEIPICFPFAERRSGAFEEDVLEKVPRSRSARAARRTSVSTQISQGGRGELWKRLP